MKIVKRVFLAVLLLLILSAIGGYLYFDQAFTPPDNHIRLSGESGDIPIQWIGSEHSDMAVMLLPIQLPGTDRLFYLQFDTGAPTTLFRRERLQDITDHFPDFSHHIDSASSVGLHFQLGEMDIASDDFPLLDRGSKPIDWADSSGIWVIGTLGADVIEKCIAIMDFKHGVCVFGQEIPPRYGTPDLAPCKFVKRKIMFPARVGGESVDLLHDSGSSGFELITSQEIWQQLARPGAEARAAFDVPSWGRMLTAYEIESDTSIV
ncbi:MAG: hypothetical protein AAF206_20045, partial [Bacteroidota bacterium]